MSDSESEVSDDDDGHNDNINDNDNDWDSGLLDDSNLPAVPMVCMSTLHISINPPSQPTFLPPLFCESGLSVQPLSGPTHPLTPPPSTFHLCNQVCPYNPYLDQHEVWSVTDEADVAALTACFEEGIDR